MPALLIVEGYPGAGKSRLGEQLAAALGPGAVHVIDADDVTQSLLAAGGSTCASFQRQVVDSARNELARQINAVDPRTLVMLVGIVTLLPPPEARPDCTGELVGCKQCPTIARTIHRVWLDITPHGAKGKDAQLDEAVKRAVIRELALPASEWNYDPGSEDPWDRVKPPTRPITDVQKGQMFRETHRAFGQRSKAYKTYLRNMKQSFLLDGIQHNYTRAKRQGYRPMRYDQVFTLGKTLSAPSKHGTSTSSKHSAVGNHPLVPALQRTRTIRPPQKPALDADKVSDNMSTIALYGDNP
jgi:hypothetical protein